MHQITRTPLRIDSERKGSRAQNAKRMKESSHCPTSKVSHAALAALALTIGSAPFSHSLYMGSVPPGSSTRSDTSLSKPLSFLPRSSESRQVARLAACIGRLLSRKHRETQ